MKPFRTFLVNNEENRVEVHPGDRTRKIGEHLFAHYWEDGEIFRKDIYWYDGKSILLESTYQRYSPFATWMPLYNDVSLYGGAK